MKKHYLFLLLLLVGLKAGAKTTIGVISIETNGINLRASQTASILRMELEKTGQYSVIDKYDIQATLKKLQIHLDSCNGKSCLVLAGKELGAEKMLTGNVDKIGGKVIVALRMIDVQTNTIEKTQIEEFLNFQDNLQDMLRITLQKMVSIPVNTELEKTLQSPEGQENKINNPGEDKLNLSGPRVGISFLTGNLADRVTASKEDGGFGGYPYMTIFGYQFEVQYLNEGNFQALFEFIPVVSGLDQNMFNPSVSVLNGFRMNRQGWEFALGPNFSIAPYSRGYYEDGHWFNLDGGAQAPGGLKAEERLDRRGNYEVRTAFVFAVGKSFRSGRLNIPLNLYFIPSTSGHRVGVSFGFNNKKGGS